MKKHISTPTISLSPLRQKIILMIKKLTHLLFAHVRLQHETCNPSPTAPLSQLTTGERKFYGYTAAKSTSIFHILLYHFIFCELNGSAKTRLNNCIVFGCMQERSLQCDYFSLIHRQMILLNPSDRFTDSK